MKERPILFASPMVRAILDGRKSVTRRIIPHRAAYKVVYLQHTSDEIKRHRSEPLSVRDDHPEREAMLEYLRTHSKYGRPGDRLWVKETWDAPPGSERISEVAYRANYERDPDGARWRPSIFMPRWASRLTLEVTSVRVERLQDITEEDAKAEGVKPFPRDPEGDCWADGKHKTAFEYLWGEINGWTGPKSWASNCWVWVVSFKRLESGEVAA